MGWQTIGGGQYYTRSVREGGRVRREYVGCGEIAVLIARFDTLEREEKEAKRQQRRSERQAEDDALRCIRWYCGTVERVVQAELTAAGYHRHDRGQWRKRRTPAMETELQQAARAELSKRKGLKKEVDLSLDRAARIKSAIVPETRAERDTIIDAAMNGNDDLEAQALACIRAYPAETVLGWGDPKHPCISLVGLREDGVRSRVFRARLEEEYAMKLRQIAGSTPTPLETLLAERITALRFQLTHFERSYEIKLAGGMSAEVSEYHQKRIERVSKQYLRAIETLAKVRRLQLPAVLVGQMNIGENQVNLGENQVNVKAAESSRAALTEGLET